MSQRRQSTRVFTAVTGVAVPKLRPLKTPLKRLDEEEIKHLAKEIITNRAYFVIEGKEMELSFGGFIALIAPTFSKSFVSSIGAVWEHMDKAGPLAVNGRPMFLSAHFVNKEDVKPIVDQVRVLQAALESV